MNAGIIAAAAVPHVPTLGLPENTPDFQLTLVEGARALGRRVVFLASSAFSHALVRGRHFKPTPEREAMDRQFIDLLKRGAIAEAIAWLPDYSRAAVAEMNGKPLATLLGALQASHEDGAQLAGAQFGGYAQSSGSGNASVAVWSR